MIIAMVLVPVVVALLLPQSLIAKRTYTAERLQAKIDVVSVPNLTPSELAGLYTKSVRRTEQACSSNGKRESSLVFPIGATSSQLFRTYARHDFDKGTWSPERDTL